MGMSFCTVFEADVPGFGTLGGDNPTIFRQQRNLDRLATLHGLTPLSAFESYRPDVLADVMGLGLRDELPLALPPLRWFPAADGLAAVRALIAYLMAHTGAVSQTIRVLADLSSIADELTAAERAGVRFRFAVVP